MDIVDEYKYLSLNWTGLKTQILCTRRVRAAGIFSGCSDLSRSVEPCYSCCGKHHLLCCNVLGQQREDG